MRMGVGGRLKRVQRIAKVKAIRLVARVNLLLTEWTYPL